MSGAFIALIGTLVGLMGACFLWQTRTLKAGFRVEMGRVRGELREGLARIEATLRRRG
ncbi:hypothetical protein OF117_08725 [Geodermatophilus sp. YIM 151500]|uniref:hypothetical protein n=1 Tax=Geodermatophilus sp. YIM 151500 TaxID=2984531 RepID=UPI0021E3CD21|nr:hypothetical protein [Geodermatophilus sp. YIM 151500]MCV2489451.1 hypothetical protein [Geodermatophilus sp. YIM 151500]